MLSCVTFNEETEREGGTTRLEGDTESSRRLEWFNEVAHHVHLGALVQLRLDPDDGIVEEVERLHEELAVEPQSFAGVDEVGASLRQHPRHFMRHRCNSAAATRHAQIDIKSTASSVHSIMHCSDELSDVTFF